MLGNPEVDSRHPRFSRSPTLGAGRQSGLATQSGLVPSKAETVFLQLEGSDFNQEVLEINVKPFVPVCCEKPSKRKGVKCLKYNLLSSLSAVICFNEVQFLLMSW